jgi:hypothetical protein
MMLDVELNASGAAERASRVPPFPQPDYLKNVCATKGVLRTTKILHLTGYPHYDSEPSWRSYESCVSNATLSEHRICRRPATVRVIASVSVKILL